MTPQKGLVLIPGSATLDGMDGQRVYTFDVEPMGAPRMNRSDAWRGRVVVERYHAYRDALRLMANLQGFTLPDRFSITFYLPMPASWSGAKRRRMNGTPHQQKFDIDNGLKGLLDALRTDDAGIWAIDGLYKVWAEEGWIEIMVRDERAS